MNEFLGSAWWLIVALGILVTFHELGHYAAARWCGVKVLRFSVGFGKPIWMRTDRHGTEWAVAPIPLGGYVRMLGEHDGLQDGRDESLPPELLAQAHDQQSVFKRMAISVARCSSATVISPRCHRSPTSHSAGAMISSLTALELRSASIASRMTTSAAISSPDNTARANARANAASCSSESLRCTTSSCAR